MEQKMKLSKIVLVSGMVAMALGGISGVMLAGYIIIVRAV